LKRALMLLTSRRWAARVTLDGSLDAAVIIMLMPGEIARLVLAAAGSAALVAKVVRKCNNSSMIDRI
jgi:hypothetical protein